MAATPLIPQNLPGGWATAPLTLTFAASDVANGNSFPATGREVVIAFNSDSVTHTLTVTSVGDTPEGRTGNLTQTVAASGYAVTQMFPLNGWQQSTGQILVSGDNALLKLAVVHIP